MNIFEAAILGLVEGVTEYLPVSSTGHLVLTASALGLGGPGPGQTATDLRTVEESLKSFEIVIQGGAILAVAGLYRSAVTAMIRGAALGTARALRLRKEPLDDRAKAALRLLLNLLVSFIPAAVVGLLAGKVIKAHLFAPGPVCAALILGGVLLIATGRWQRRRHGEALDDDPDNDLPAVTLRQAIVIGLAQTLALWPGTSRSMVTILAGMFGGLSPRRAAEYSFLLGLPTLGCATLYELAKECLGGEHGWRGIEGLQAFVDSIGGWAPVLTGIGVAAISAAIAIKWLVGWLSRHSLELFGWWRIVIGGAFLAAIAMGLVG